VSDRGLACLEALGSEFQDLDVPPSPEVCFKRLEEVCEFFKQLNQQGRTVKKLKREYPEPPMAIVQEGSKPREFLEPKKKVLKTTLQRDAEGNIVYPIRINSSLTIANLGVIEHRRPLFHNDKNFFPIGFRSLREHNSQTRPGERCLYVCEVLDGREKPQYRVTAMDDPGNPIVKDSSTGCWVSGESTTNNYRSRSARRSTNSRGASEATSQSAAPSASDWRTLV